jgi:pilus assembly protein CpaB
MNRTRMLMLASVALVLSVAVTFLTYRLLRQRLQPPDEMTTIVVASQRIALGSRLTAQDIRVAPWPKAAVVAGSAQDPAVFIGRGVIQPMEANEPILESKLAPKDGGAGLTTTIPEGMRAVSIRVNDVIGVAGFVVPGSRVDVILSGSPNSGATDVAKIILENVQVLAAGQNIDQDINGKPQTVQVVTLLVTPEDSQKLALASTEGRMQLALRNPLDKETPNPPLVLRATLYTGAVLPAPAPATPAPAPRPRRVVVAAPPPPPPPPPAPVVAEPKKFQVQLIQGNASQTLTFDQQQPPQQ